MNFDDDLDEPTLFASEEEYNLMMLYIIAIGYDIVKIYYSYSVFLEHYHMFIMIFMTYYSLEKYLTITSYELKKMIIVFTSFMIINDICIFNQKNIESCMV